MFQDSQAHSEMMGSLNVSKFSNRSNDMGFFSMFKRNKNDPNLENIVVSWFRTETSNLLGIEANTKEYDNACQSAGETLKVMLPVLDKQLMQDVSDTLASVSSERFHEMFGEYMILLFVRFSVISKEILTGRVSAKEATPNILADVLHEQLKHFIKQVKLQDRR
ncbi:hypothetical protein ABXJ76_10220 [Methylobacter sp. G7]|uniref:hypothetical protein n=1 Tax=Methylobacter sp. G7 TaxID=3230117 RepID=UPI003D8081D5